MGQTRRVTLREAAEILGISKDAVRKRINRGTLPSDVGEDGRRYVYLPAGGDAGGDAVGGGDQPDNHEHGEQGGRIDELRSRITDLQDQVRYLREQLDAEREARTEERRRADTVIAQLTSRIPRLEAPREPQDEPETVPEELGRGDMPPTPPEPEGATERPQRSWWRRMFGG